MALSLQVINMGPDRKPLTLHTMSCLDMLTSLNLRLRTILVTVTGHHRDKRREIEDRALSVATSPQSNRPIQVPHTRACVPQLFSLDFSSTFRVSVKLALVTATYCIRSTAKN